MDAQKMAKYFDKGKSRAAWKIPGGWKAPLSSNPINSLGFNPLKSHTLEMKYFDELSLTHAQYSQSFVS